MIRRPPLWCAVLFASAGLAGGQTRVHSSVVADDHRVRRGGHIGIGTAVIADADGDGVVQVAIDDAVIDFGGALLRGAPAGRDPDAYSGIGVLVTGDRVTIRNLAVSGYKIGVLARGADDLVLEDLDVSDNFRQRLGSTADVEDPADWISPHQNDAGQWAERYGAGIWLEALRGPVVRRCRARNGQNGLVLVRTDGGQVYDNDFSFLSGWGLALWRSSDNVIAHNALDFCVRGYSHGVYNRGQDSAGILMFEQCSRNLIAENSASHGGDGFFGFAGREALGEDVEEASPRLFRRRGCNDNLLVRNDFSYAAAHGVEMTFGFGNRVIGNRLVGNAICGFWGGYSRDTLVAANLIAWNGDAGYGLERGGVNIEHGAGNRVLANHFRGNSCGVHLWWDPDEHFAQKPWALANGTASRGNVVAGNRFVGDEIGLHLRDCEDTRVANNSWKRVGERTLVEGGQEPSDAPADLHWVWPELDLPGEARPVGARADLAGREHIVLTQWGPWDRESALLERLPERGGAQHWIALGVQKIHDWGADGEVDVTVQEGPYGPVLAVAPRTADALVPYRIRLETDRGPLVGEGLLVACTWRVAVFPWETDPREDDAPWRGELPADAVQFELPALTLPFGSGGASDLGGVSAEVRAAGLPVDGFGTVAETELFVPAGEWTLRFTSDDGLRVYIDGARVHDDWNWHPAKEDRVQLRLALPRRVALRLEHFELDGAAVLSGAFEPRR